MASLGSRMRKVWSVFRSPKVDSTEEVFEGFQSGWGGIRQDRPRFIRGGERTIIGSIYTRIGIDASSISIRHAKVSASEQFQEVIKSELDICLTLDANVDQTGRAFIQDVVMTMLDKGVVAIVAVETTDNPNDTGAFDVLQLRTGTILEWYPQHVRVEVYDDRDGKRKELVLPKRQVAIVENPLYSVMNEPNSTLQRLIRKLHLLDAVDEQSSSGKLDLIIQLPYTIKSEARRQQAQQRREDIEWQLKGSQYGIAYIDGTERITQLNRPAENTLLKQVQYLTEMLYAELGLTKSIMDGTASESSMLNYYNRTIEPIVAAIALSMRRTFLTKTARSQGQSIVAIRDPFKYVPIGEVADMADKFIRNELMTSNEVRGIIGMAPSSEKQADMLHNPNMPAEKSGSGGSDTPAMSARRRRQIREELEAKLAAAEEEEEEDDDLP